jgi:TetR/AcrR family transcriptional regulator, cholesterol catabolism regulator
MTTLQDSLKDTAAGNDGAARIRRAALALIRDRGFHGTSVRQLGQAVDMESASLYYHYPSKQAILVDLFHQTMDDLIDGAERAVSQETGAVARLRAAVLFHVHFHISHQDEAFVSHSELRALVGPNRKAIIAKRDRYETLFRNLIDAGCREGVFAVDDLALTSTALLMMCSGVSDWFGPQGRLSADVVAHHYTELALRLVQRPACPQDHPR